MSKLSVFVVCLLSWLSVVLALQNSQLKRAIIEQEVFLQENPQEHQKTLEALETCMALLMDELPAPGTPLKRLNEKKEKNDTISF